MSLIDARGGARRHEGSDEAWAAFHDLFCDDRLPDAHECWEAVRNTAEGNGWRWCSYEACRRLLNGRISPEERARRRTPKKYDQQLARTSLSARMGGRREIVTSAIRNSLIWCADSARGFCGPGSARGWIGGRAVCRVGVTPTPNSWAILAAFREAMMDEANFGGPAHAWIDNGKAYDCWLFHGQTKQQRRQRLNRDLDEPRAHGIFNALKITPHFSIPFNANGKARLERWFRTLGKFCRTFDTYTGDGSDTKPERLNEVLENPRLVPMFQTIQERMKNHIGGYNADADHARYDVSDDGFGSARTARWLSGANSAGSMSKNRSIFYWPNGTSPSPSGVTASRSPWTA